MINKNYIKLLRSKQSFNKNIFIYDIIAKRIIDSIDLVKKNYDNVLEIGMNENSILDYIENKSIIIALKNKNKSFNPFSEKKVPGVKIKIKLRDKNSYIEMYFDNIHKKEWLKK